MTNRRLLAPLLALTFAVTLPLAAERGDDSNRKSKNGLTEGEIDGVRVTLEYGRPNVKGRDLWGGLVPFGKIWRTGADEATTVSFDADVAVEGEKLAAGTYGLFTVPGEEEWTVVFNKVAAQWGAFRYDDGEDALRVTVTPRPAEHVESMEFSVEEDEVVLRWGELAVPVRVEAAP